MIIIFNNCNNDRIRIYGNRWNRRCIWNNYSINIKESECLNVVLVEMVTILIEAISILREKPTKNHIESIPINSVVETNLEFIITKSKELSNEKTQRGDSFYVNCVIMNEERLTSLISKMQIRRIN